MFFLVVLIVLKIPFIRVRMSEYKNGKQDYKAFSITVFAKKWRHFAPIKWLSLAISLPLLHNVLISITWSIIYH